MSKEEDDIKGMFLPPPIATSNDFVSLVPNLNIKYLDTASSDIFERYGMGRMGGASGRGWSSFSTMQRCPYLFKVRYIDKIRGLPALALELGSAFHTFLALHYRWMRDETWKLTPEIFKEELLGEGVRPEPVIEAWRLYDAYRYHYENDYLIPLEEEYWAEDPDGNSCRYDLIAKIAPNNQFGLPAGAVIGEHKALILQENILTPSGYRMMGDLQVDDEVVDPDTGKPARITGVHPQGVVDLHEIRFENSTSVTCCADHLWLAYVDGVEQVVPLKTILSWKGERNIKIPQLLNFGSYQLQEIVNIQPVAPAEAQCITVDSKRNLYALSNGIMTHNTAARFTSDYLEGWRNDGEILGQIMIWKRAGLDDIFGPLVGNLVNIVGKQKKTQFHRTFIPYERWHVQQHMQDLKMWSAMQRMYEASGFWPRSRANCTTKFGTCELMEYCATNRDPVQFKDLVDKQNLLKKKDQLALASDSDVGNKASEHASSETAK